MKIKFFFLTILFLGFGLASFAQSQATDTEKKDAPKAQITTTSDQSKAGDCAGHQSMGAKADCKWVDANNDGKCDQCGKTEAECKAACAPAPKKSGCSSTCPMQKSCGEATPPKDGKK